MNKIMIEDYRDDMLAQLMQLFYDTVHTVNAKDYNPEQLERWAPSTPDVVSWKQRLKNNVCKVAVVNNTIAGFAELSDDAHVDTMYVHKDYQGRGVAKQLMNELLQLATQRGYEVLTTESSITAKPLFEYFGFEVARVKKKLHNGKEFINYKMTKALR
jgi:putative acetyltransferase